MKQHRIHTPLLLSDFYRLDAGTHNNIFNTQMGFARVDAMNPNYTQERQYFMVRRPKGKHNYSNQRTLLFFTC